MISFGTSDSRGWKVKLSCCPEIVWGGSRKLPESYRILKGRYQMVEGIKSGGMGSVFRARDIQQNTLVAVKRMYLPSGAEQEKNYARKHLNHEAEILSRFHHRGIPRFIDFFTEFEPATNRFAQFLVMEYIEGRDLESIMRERIGVPLLVEEALHYMQHLLAILSYLHTRRPSIIYRDIKPSNIMLNPRTGSVHLVDFGIAQERTPGLKGLIIGTPGYAPPEQYGGYSTERSDLYALGAAMHYLLTGIDPEDANRPPFTFEPIRSINPEVPEYLESIIMAMLESDSLRRPSSARKILQMLEKKFRIPSLKSLSLPDRFNTNQRNLLRVTPLHRAATRGDVAAARLLLTAGVNINQQDIMGLSPLHYAARAGHPALAALLIDEGADINLADWQNRTPLFLAVEGNKRDIARMLLKNGALPAMTDRSRTSPLHLAARKGYADIIEILIQHGAEIDIRDQHDETPLHKAVRGRKKHSVERLLKLGAEVNARNRLSWTPLTLARYCFASTDLINVLRNHGAQGKSIWELAAEYY